MTKPQRELHEAIKALVLDVDRHESELELPYWLTRHLARLEMAFWDAETARTRNEQAKFVRSQDARPAR